MRIIVLVVTILAPIAVIGGLLFANSADSAQSDLIVLSDDNTISLNMPIMGSSARDIQTELLRKSAGLSPTKPLYLFLNSPGGSVTDGERIVEVARGLPQKVHTISLFSASMSFIISQYLDNRYITESGVMMSHRAYSGGYEGQVPGNLITRTLFTLAQIVAVDRHVAERAGMGTKQYEDLIANELWMDSQEAIHLKLADKTVRVRCDKTLQGPGPAKNIEVFMFKVAVTFHKCPLITEPLSVELANSATPEARTVVERMFHDKESFVHEYVETGRLNEVVR